VISLPSGGRFEKLVVLAGDLKMAVPAGDLKKSSVANCVDGKEKIFPRWREIFVSWVGERNEDRVA